jgi:uncharacterized protein (TIGR02145 family)
MSKHYLLSIIFISLIFQVHAQVGIGTQTPDPSAMLDVVSNSKGVLITRMTQKQRNAILSPANGLLIYQTDIIPGFYYYSGNQWKYLTPGLTGTANRINVSTAINPTIDIAPTYIGQTSITTLGTITAGTWNGNIISANKGGAGNINGILKANGSGVVSAAVSGVDYLKPNSNTIVPATKTKITYNAQGLITSGSDATTSDIIEGVNQYFTNARARTAISLTTLGNTGPATYNASTGVLNIPQYSGGSGSSSYTFSSPLSLSGTTVSISQSSATKNGFLSSADWISFSNKLSPTDAAILYAPIASPTFTGTVSGITKGMVGLSFVDNTSDLDKPISNATQNALSQKLNIKAPIVPSTKTKITYDENGLITNGENANTSDILEGENLYFTEERVRKSKLTGLVEGENLIVDSTDQLLAAIGKLQAQITALQNAINGKLIKKSNFSGLVQKGPFIQGTQVVASDLDKNLNQTGSTFITQIENQNGFFSLDSIALTSGLVKLSATGYYFNENTGTISDGPLTLHDFVDIKDINNANINILTSLEKERIEKLYKEGTSINDAKKQATQEILHAFGINVNLSSNSEQLSISDYGNENAILLAISVICQNKKSTGELSEFIATFSEDLKSDGTIDNQNILENITYAKKSVPLYDIRNNLENRYKKLNNISSIPNFEDYVQSNLLETKDQDGNSYKTFIVGDTEWMMENLKTITYSNGDPIIQISDDFLWSTTKNGAYCYYNNETNNFLKFGNLYNAYAVMDNRNICPTGWRPAVDKDYQKLIDLYGGVDFIGGNIKGTESHLWYDGDTTDLINKIWSGAVVPPNAFYNERFWPYPNYGATNSFRFSCLPGGWRDGDYLQPMGKFYEIGTSAHFWSTDNNQNPDSQTSFGTSAWSSSGGLNSSDIPNRGYSVRCVKKIN